jgi:hypothetical protein
LSIPKEYVEKATQHAALQYCLQFASEDTILFLDQQGKAEMLDILLMLVA